MHEDMTAEKYYSQTGIETEEICKVGDGAADIDSLNIICDGWKSSTVRHFRIRHGHFLTRRSAVKTIVDFFVSDNS